MVNGVNLNHINLSKIPLQTKRLPDNGQSFLSIGKYFALAFLHLWVFFALAFLHLWLFFALAFLHYLKNMYICT